MHLLQETLRAKLPPLRSCEKESDPMLVCKFFTPDAHWTWYAIEFDGKETFLGWVEGDFNEFGYFRLSDFEAIRIHWGLVVRWDLDFEPCRFSQLHAERR